MIMHIKKIKMKIGLIFQNYLEFWKNLTLLLTGIQNIII